MSQDMKREFASRDELIAYVREQFPEADARDRHVVATPCGRKAALKALQQVDAGKYASTRNFLNGAVTRGEFGIHFDANVPGEAWCIVLRNQSGWSRFCTRPAAIAIKGVKLIPLSVHYI